MSKVAKSRSKEKRQKEKKKRKEAQRLLYESYTRAGKTKSKRQTIKSKKLVKPVKCFDHPLGPCGNVGCRKCNK